MGWANWFRACGSVVVVACLSGCPEQSVMTPITDEIGMVDCTCRLQLGGVGPCDISKCECAALATGSCAAPRNDAQCREELADAIDNCLGGIPPRPNPATISLPTFDALCSRFTPKDCLTTFTASFCTGDHPADGTEARQRCEPICQATARFLDFTFSRQSTAYSCNDVFLASTVGKPGRKQECSLDCPSIECTVGNIDTCTVVKLPTNETTPGLCTGTNRNSTAPGYESAPFCRAPDSDPPVLAAGGILADMTTRRSRVELDPQASHVTISIDGTPTTIRLDGRADVLGETCAGCPVSVHLSLSGQPLTVSGTSLSEIHISAGTGTVPVVPTDASGAGIIPAGALDGTLSLSINGVPNAVTTRNLTAVSLQVDRTLKTFRMSGPVRLQRGTVVATGTLHLEGPITNQPPTTSLAATPLELPCVGNGATVDLLGTATDPDGEEDLINVAWYRVDGANKVGLSRWFSASANLPLGTSTLEFAAMDRGLQTATSTLTVSVTDTAPPVLEPTAETLCLWPPNHEYVLVSASELFSASDSCSGTPQVTLTGATSNQPDDAQGDGHTSQDVVLFDDRVCLRVERAGPGEAGREYAISAVARDPAGNLTSTKTATLRVPHDLGNGEACKGVVRGVGVDAADARCRPAPAPAAPEGSPTRSSMGCHTAPAASFAWLLSLLLVRRRRAQ